MKGLLTLGLGLLSLAATAASSVTINGTRFAIDGKTAYLAGTNSYWISFLSNTRDVDTVLDHISSSGLKVLRIWGFNDVNRRPSSGTAWFQLLSSSGSQINTGSDGLQRLDNVVRSAEKRGVKLIINFVNYWDDYGGMKAYTSAFGGSKEGWYTNARAQEQYKKYIAAIVGRYINSDAIFAWELANEPRCKGCNTDVIYKWATDISNYIRGLDPNHLITLGDEGFGLPGQTSYPYQYSEGVDFVKNLGVKNLDFGTFHMYPGSWGVANSFGPGWIRDHAAACKKAGKPCVLEEYGVTSDHCNVQKSWQQVSRELALNGMASDMFWQWGDQLSTGQTHNDGHTVYYGSSMATCLVTDHNRTVKMLLSLLSLITSLPILLLFASPVSSQSPVRIMPLGDSITGSPGCWRALLWRRLQQAQITNTKFVGSLPAQGCGFTYDGANEGHGGILATNIVSQKQLPRWLSSAKPDVVMMHLGTNDVWNNKSPEVILAAFSTMVDWMRESNPKMKILVAQIIPMNPPNCRECGRRVEALNKGILGWAESINQNQTAAGASPIRVVDCWTGFDTARMTGDGVHPNSAGNEKLAACWFDELVRAIKG
ncbi:mannan endo-1,4-beta-mannosidase A [Cladorrhinum sp. PSN332]|nr:mannan endo-1,4-beta-mannosidase A [Cladorrhinum sp. PSN332]